MLNTLTAQLKGNLQCLGALKSQLPTPAKKWLMYVSTSINGHPVRALLDTGAMHNFISENEAKRLGLKVTKERGTMKAVNSPAKPIAGTTQGVCVTLGTWSEKLDFFIVPTYDFKMVLNIEFFDQVCAFPLPATNSQSIIDGSMACMVPAEHSKSVDKTLSVMQFKKAFQKDPSF